MYAKIKYQIKTVNGWLSASIPVSKIDQKTINQVVIRKLKEMHPNCEIKTHFIDHLSDDAI